MNNQHLSLLGNLLSDKVEPTMKRKFHRTRRYLNYRAHLGTCAMMLIVVIALAESAYAQRVQRIAATVNEDIVSQYDLQARLRVVIFSSGLQPTQQLQRRLSQQVLRNLIDERLQLQEAKKRNITVSKRNLNRAIQSIEKQNRLKPGTFDQYLAQNGIPRDSLMSQIRAQILWQKLVGRVLLPRVSVGEDEIDEALQRLKERKGQTEYRISEILLTNDQPERETEVRRTAQRLLEELRKGAKFSAIARQFSQTASASVGGDLGWLQEATMSTELREIISGMEEGATVGPVKTLSGIQLFRLVKKRQVLAGSPDDTVVDLQQILLPVAKGLAKDEIEAQSDLAQTLSDTVSNCSDHRRAAVEVGTVGNAKLGKVRLGNLSKLVRTAVEKLPVGKASPPVRTGGGIAVFMVCDRKEAETGLPTREEIRSRMQEERVSVLARRYLRDLRASAIVDLRV